MRISDWSSDVCSSDLGAYGRIELNVILHEGADFHLGAAQIGGREQNLEIVTTVTHAEPGATSRQVVRSVLGGTATGTYLGKEIGRASGRERVCQYVEILVVAVSLKKKQIKTK